MTKKTMVVFSGGQDSVTCLFWALSQFDRVSAVSFDYGQRHSTELEAASEIARDARVDHSVIDLRGFGRVAQSALTDHTREVNATGGLGGLPSTFTPGRNLVFLTVAASKAISEGVNEIVTGVCQTDYSGYPDCRRETIDSLEKTIALGNGLEWFRIHTPLMFINKAETVKMAHRLGTDAWRALGRSVTCYYGFRPGCGKCPACTLRGKGFAEAGLIDPAHE